MGAIRTTFVSGMTRPLEARTAFLVLAILLLNLLDGVLTLTNICHGAEEVNPIMQSMLVYGSEHFFIFKHLLASFGLIGIAMHGEVRAAQVALRLLFAIYFFVAVWGVVVFIFIPM